MDESENSDMGQFLGDKKARFRANLKYRTRAIISRGFYIFYPIFKEHFFVFKEVFSESSVLMYGIQDRSGL